MCQIQEVNTKTSPLESISFMGIAFFVGSSRLIQYFPGTSKGGLLMTAGLTSAFSCTYNHFYHDPNNHSYLKTLFGKVATIAFATLCSIYLAKPMKRHLTLSIESAVKFGIIESILTAVFYAKFSDAPDQPTEFFDGEKGSGNITAQTINKTPNLTCDKKAHQAQITDNAFGKLICKYEAKDYSFGNSPNNGAGKDAILVPNQEPNNWNWNWKQPSMSHAGTSGQRCFDISDYDEFIEKPIFSNDALKESVLQNGLVVIITMGRGHDDKGPGILKISTSSIGAIEQKPYVRKVIVCKTQEAISLYNDLANQQILVAGMFHTTC